MRTMIQLSVITGVLALGLMPSAAMSDQTTTYRGVLMPAEGFEHIPNGGTAIHITVAESADGTLTGRLRAMGVDAPLSRVERMGDTIVLSGSIGEMPVTAELKPDGLELHGTVSAMEFVFPVVPMPEDWIPRPRKPFRLITKEDWLADLDYLADALPRNHRDWHSLIRKRAWRKAVKDARKVILSGTSEAAFVALVELIAAGRDPHTWLPFIERGTFKSVPVRMRWLPDGLFVTAAPSGYKDIIGGRVTQVGNVAAEAALERLARLVAFDNPQWKRWMVGKLVPIPRLLHTVGLSDTPETLELVVRGHDGKDRKVSIARGGSRKVTSWQEVAGVETPLWLTQNDKPYWFTSIDNNAAVYVAYNSCMPDPTRPFSEFTNDIMSKLKRGGAGRVIIDLRNNPGGNSNVIFPLLAALAEHKVINQPDRLFVLIGPGTFSSAMDNAIRFRTTTRATLVGEPTGGKPNQFGNISQRYLPKSGFGFPVSTKYYEFDPSDPPSVAPDVQVVLKSADFFAGRDPVMEKVRSIPIKSPGW